MSTIILFAISLCLFLLGKFFDTDIASTFLMKFTNHQASFSKLFTDWGIVFLLLSITNNFLLINGSKDLLAYYNDFPFHTFLLISCFFFSLFNAIKRSKFTDVLIEIEDIKYSNTSIHYFEYHLIKLNNKLSRLERKLSTLKSFSIVPVLLVVLPNVPELYTLFVKRYSFKVQDYGNLFLTLFCVSYFYLMYKTYKNCQKITFLIGKIQQEQFLARHPDSRKKKS